jgi:hypothetical protein
MPQYRLTAAKQALAINEITALIVSQRAGRDAFPPETVAADIIDRVLRRQMATDPQTIEGTCNDDGDLPQTQGAFR